MVREGDGGVLKRKVVSGAIDFGECAANGCGATGMVLVRVRKQKTRRKAKRSIQDQDPV